MSVDAPLPGGSNSDVIYYLKYQTQSLNWTPDFFSGIPGVKYKVTRYDDIVILSIKCKYNIDPSEFFTDDNTDFIECTYYKDPCKPTLDCINLNTNAIVNKNYYTIRLDYYIELIGLPLIALNILIDGIDTYVGIVPVKVELFNGDCKLIKTWHKIKKSLYNNRIRYIIDLGGIKIPNHYYYFGVTLSNPVPDLGNPYTVYIDDIIWHLDEHGHI